MVGIQHGEAVSILKSTQGVVQLQVEKGAMQSMGIVTTPEPDPPIQPESQPDGTNAFSVDVQVSIHVHTVMLRMFKVCFALRCPDYPHQCAAFSVNSCTKLMAE